jgi:thioredoxin-related protein
MHRKSLLRIALLLTLAALLARPAAAQVPSPHAIDIPRWFSLSLLDFKDEIPEAARQGKRVMVYFGQDGCPYCKALMQGSFGPGPIADKMKQHFVAIAINLWGDADVTWIDGRRTTEKALARQLGVQFTPTLLFFETDGRLVLRLNGYLPPERFTHVLDWVIERRDRELSLAEYMATKLRFRWRVRRAPTCCATPRSSRAPAAAARSPCCSSRRRASPASRCTTRPSRGRG